MATYDTQFVIDAPAARVWQVLTDFRRYGEWNTAIPSIEGDLRVGSVLLIQLRLGGRPMNVKATVQDLFPQRLFGWKGHLGAEVLFTGVRTFTIVELEKNRTSFRHYEAIRGLLAVPFGLLRRRAIRDHHRGFDRSIKQRVEGLAA